MITRLLLRARQTTSQELRCKKCGNLLFGEKGYLTFSIEANNDRWTEHRFNVCLNCIENESKTINKNKWKALVKSQVIKKLK